MCKGTNLVAGKLFTSFFFVLFADIYLMGLQKIRVLELGQKFSFDHTDFFCLPLSPNIQPAPKRKIPKTALIAVLLI